MQQLYIKLIKPCICEKNGEKMLKKRIEEFDYWYPEDAKSDIMRAIEAKYKPEDESRIQFHRHFHLQFLECFEPVEFNMIKTPPHYSEEVTSHEE